MSLSPQQEAELDKILHNGDAMASSIFAALGCADLPTLDEADEISEALDKMEEDDA